MTNLAQIASAVQDTFTLHVTLFSRLSEKGGKAIEEIVVKMKERDRKKEEQK